MSTALARSTRLAALMLILVATLLVQVGCETTSMIREKGYVAMRNGDTQQANQQFGAQSANHRSKNRSDHGNGRQSI